MRLIDADALTKQIEEMANNDWNISVGSSKGLEDALDVIENAPAVIRCGTTSDGLPLFDLTPRPRGEWQEVDFAEDYRDEKYKCSNCEKVFNYVNFCEIMPLDCFPNFCPNCGAQMRGGGS